ncbi:MAG: hypothetical protein IJS45_07780 [Clostridia bacterium]|nr:hypothetical protein [Clostridia bacterium]
MTQTANRRRKVVMPSGIRKKFAAALCMLLVAAIMMVGSTYAWFTLSTAPEVTGITTNVGANGNLEIALLNDTSFYLNTNDLGITSGVTDSMATQPIEEANETWGNLVDLSPASYGLSHMILNPAALNYVEGTNAGDFTGIGGGMNSPLLAPNYGSDGRVIDVLRETQSGRADASGSRFVEAAGLSATRQIGGVRVIGVSSGITVRISTYRQAISLVSSYMNEAKLAAQDSLVRNGQELASALIEYAADENYAITADGAAAMINVIDSLAASNDAIANAIRYAAVAIGLSGSNEHEFSDAEVASVTAAVEAADITTVAALQALIPGSDLTALSDAVTQYNNLKAETAALVAKKSDIDEGAVLASLKDDVFDKMISKDNVTVNGTAGSELSTNSVGTLASKIVSDGRVVVTMGDGSGVYADIANLVGDYTASGLNLTISYNGISVDNMPAVMNTNCIGNGETAAIVGSIAGVSEAQSAGGAASIDDPYGYIIDFGVRTNAAGSDLLIDSEGSQRVYEGHDNSATQGSGTYLEFSTSDANKFSLDDVKALMSAVRVVFVTPNEDASKGYDILGIAAADINASAINQSGVRTVTAGEGVTDNGTDTVKAKLFLYNYDFTSVDPVNNNKGYVLNLGSKKANAGSTPENPDYDFKLTSLEQNKAKKISVLVYLDGDIVDNTFVANASISMSGKLNLQFKSSAELTPMDVTSMRNAGQVAASGITFTQFTTALNGIKMTSVYTTAAAKAADARTEAEAALMTAVANAEAATAETSSEDLTTLATALGTAYANAGGVNPFN